LSGLANGSNVPGEFHLVATLEGDDPQLQLGDIQARDTLALTLLGNGRYVVGTGAVLSSLGQVKLVAPDAALIIDGTVRSGFDLDDSSLDVVIEADGTLTSDWPGLYTKRDSTELGEQLILGNIG